MCFICTGQYTPVGGWIDDRPEEYRHYICVFNAPRYRRVATVKLLIISHLQKQLIGIHGKVHHGYLASSYRSAKFRRIQYTGLQTDYGSSIVVAPDFTYGDAANNSLLLFESELTMYVEASDGAVITGRLPGYTIVVDCPNLPYIRAPINLCVLAYVFC